MANRITIEDLQEADYSTKEAFNSLRTNLQFCGNDVQIIAFTSCIANEGKTTTVIELARSMAENGKKVLLLDCDLRKSVLVGRYHIETDHMGEELKGMSHFLSGQAKTEEVIYETDIPGLDMVVAGHMTPNPTELLGGENFKTFITQMREKYDMVLIDSPPLGTVIDTAVIAPVVDGVILIIESNRISYRFAQDVKKQLSVTGCRILGVVMNKVAMEKGGYYNRYYKGYYKGYYKKYYGKEEYK